MIIKRPKDQQEFLNYYKNKIKYDSPSGFINIIKYIPPFMKADGFGFLGILAEDSKDGTLQCHICGQWFLNLSTHIGFIHNLTSKEYKDKFGLSYVTALKSKQMRLNQSKVMIELRKKNIVNRGKFEKNNIYAGNRKDKPKSIEDKNKKGTCDLQVTDKIMKLFIKLNKTPSLIELKDEYGFGIITLLRRRYGSYIEACKNFGLIPLFSNHNPKYSREYFINKRKESLKVLFSEIFDSNEQRAFYKHFKSFSELNEVIQ